MTPLEVAILCIAVWLIVVLMMIASDMYHDYRDQKESKLQDKLNGVYTVPPEVYKVGLSVSAYGTASEVDYRVLWGKNGGAGGIGKYGPLDGGSLLKEEYNEKLQEPKERDATGAKLYMHENGTCYLVYTDGHVTGWLVGDVEVAPFISCHSASQINNRKDYKLVATL